MKVISIPLPFLSTLPSAGVGALVALLIFPTELNIIAMIGLILLIGLVKKNGILMVDFALDAERLEGKNSHDSIYEACLLRFRPIMMTTMSAIFGAVPLAFGTGMGSELRRPLGIAIIGGLIFSQMLTLYTTPVIYLYMERFKIWFECMRKNSSTKGCSMFSLRNQFFLVTFLASAVLFSGCAIGPKYVRPTTQIPAAYKESADWKKAQPQDEIIRGAWWKIFNDPQLDALGGPSQYFKSEHSAGPGAVCPGLCLGAGSQVKFFPDAGRYRLLIRGHIPHRGSKSKTDFTEFIKCRCILGIRPLGQDPPDRWKPIVPVPRQARLILKMPG